MHVPTVYITRVNVALAGDTAMLSLGSPSGPVTGGQIAVEEAFRAVLSQATLREVAALLTARVAEMDAAEAASAASATQQQIVVGVEEERSFEEEGVTIRRTANLQ